MAAWTLHMTGMLSGTLRQASTTCAFLSVCLRQLLSLGLPGKQSGKLRLLQTTHLQQQKEKRRGALRSLA